MRSTLLFVCALPLLMMTGCTANFCGQWLEEGVKAPDGTMQSAAGERRVALEFDAISGMRWGLFDERIGMVDCGTVQSDSYYVFDGWNQAQFGAVNAKVNGDQMTAGILGGAERHFRRLPGKDVFPPMVKIPSLTEQ